MTTFIEERLLEKVAFGTSSGIEYKTLVKSLSTGVEARKGQWLRPLGRFSVIYKFLKPEDRAHVIRVFRICRGRLIGFRLRDPLDHLATNEVIGVATGAEQTLQLIKSETFGGITEVQPIYKPDYVEMFADGAPMTPINIDMTTGQVTFLAAADAVISWSGVFDKPVRFDSDSMAWTLDDKAGGQIPLASTDMDLAEIRIL